jgi:type IV secretion system protein VirB10
VKEINPDKEEGRKSGLEPQPESDDDARPLTGEPAAPMRLRPEPPRVTRLSRKVLAGLGLVAGVGIGGALIYALQVQHDGRSNEELY